MTLAVDRFSKHNFLFVGQDGGKRIGTCYTYDSHKTLYDVKEYDGVLYFVRNMGIKSSEPTNPIHHAILKHFDLEPMFNAVTA